MTTDNRSDAILVKLTTYDESGAETMVCAYHTICVEQTLKMFKYMKDEQIPFVYDGEEYFINNILVHFGNSRTDNVPCIEVIS